MDDHQKALAEHFTANGRTEVPEAEVKEFIKEIKAAARRCRKAAGPVVESWRCYETEFHFGSQREESKFTNWSHGQSQGAWIVLGASAWSGWGKNGNYTEQVPKHDKIAARKAGLEKWAEAQDAEPLGHLFDAVRFNYGSSTISLTFDRMSHILRGQGVVITEDPDRLARLAATSRRARIRYLHGEIRHHESNLQRYKAELEELEGKCKSE